MSCYKFYCANLHIYNYAISNSKVVIDYTIVKNKSWLYEADFIFSYDGERFVVENHKGFKVATDLVAHAFSKWKRKVLGFWGFLK